MSFHSGDPTSGTTTTSRDTLSYCNHTCKHAFRSCQREQQMMNSTPWCNNVPKLTSNTKFALRQTNKNNKKVFLYITHLALHTPPGSCRTSCQSLREMSSGSSLISSVSFGSLNYRVKGGRSFKQIHARNEDEVRLNTFWDEEERRAMQAM